MPGIFFRHLPYQLADHAFLVGGDVEYRFVPLVIEHQIVVVVGVMVELEAEKIQRARVLRPRQALASKMAGSLRLWNIARTTMRCFSARK